MKKTRNLLFLIIIIISYSCNTNEGKFMISNESDFNINSLSIFPDGDNKMISLKKGEMVHHVIDMEAVKADGGYRISFKNESTGQTISQAFGYYTNGYQVEDNMNIRILNDTIVFNSKFNSSY